jgi:hypothetical protein
MTESYITEIDSVEGVRPVATSDSDYSNDPLVARVQKAMEEIGVAEAKTKAEEAILDDLIQTKLVAEDDPFIAMMNAMLIVIPQLMKTKEELLVEKTASYDYISSLNAYMAETQQNFSMSGEKTADISLDGGVSGGTTTGLAYAKAYAANLSTLQTEGLFDGMSGDMQGILYEAVSTSLGLEALTPETRNWNSSFTKDEYTMPETLWAGLNSPDWIFEGEDTSRYTNKGYADDSDLFRNAKGELVDQTAALYLSGKLGPVVDDAVTQNTIIENTLNGYSKQVEAGYKFEMENYNAIVNTDAQMYQAQINQNRAHTNRLRAL